MKYTNKIEEYANRLSKQHGGVNVYTRDIPYIDAIEFYTEGNDGMGRDSLDTVDYKELE